MRRALLVGQPNVGKSSLLRALTGARATISNYPGTTVDVYRGRAVLGGEEYELIDTPGVYNLFPSSLEEEVTEKAILEGAYDVVVQVVDATALERSLLLTVALAELGVPLLIALNFWEEAAGRGVIIDPGRLEELLGCPVVPVNPYKKTGLQELGERLGEASPPSISILYDDDIEEAIKEAEQCLGPDLRLSRRGLAVRILEGDPVAYRLYGCEKADEAREKLAAKGHDPQSDIEATRAGYAFRIAREATSMQPGSEELSAHLHFLDRLLLDKTYVGAPLVLSVLAAVIVLVVYLGGLAQRVLLSLLSPAVIGASAWAENLGSLAARIVDSVLNGLLGQYAAAVPYVFTFYLLLAVLEDTGLLSREILVLYKATSRLGISAKGIVPVMLGLGCSVPAVRATRLLPDSKQKTIASLMVSMIPCSSRAAIIFGLVGFYLGPLWALSVYAIGAALAVGAGFLASKALGSRPAFMVEDLPPYRIPRLGSVLLKAWWKLEDFLVLVTPLVILGAAAYALLDFYGLAAVLVGPLGFFVKSWLGLPPETIIPLAYGFLQKDLTIGMLASVLGTTDFSSALSSGQIYVFGLASSLQVPCVIALGSMVRELGPARAFAVFLFSLGVGLAVSGLAARLLA